MFFEASHSYSNHIPLVLLSFLSVFLFLNFPCSSNLFLCGLGFFFSNFPYYHVGLFWVVSIVLSRLELFLVFLSLIWYIFLLLPLFTFICSGVRGSLEVVVCPFFPTFLVGIFPFYHSSVFPYICPIMRTSSGPSRPYGLRVGGSSAEGLNLGHIGGRSSRPAIFVDQVPLAGPPSPYGKGKGKVSEIRYPGGSAYLRATVQNAEAVGPNRVEPSFGHNFASLYGPPFGVWVWCPDFLTSYIVQVPKMVCFFEAAFENGLRLPLHPFIKSVLQHFNVCPAQLSPNF